MAERRHEGTPGVDARIAAMVEAFEQIDDVEQLGPMLLEALSRLTGADAVYLTVIDWEAEEQHIVHAVNTEAETTVVAHEGTVIPWAETLCHVSLREPGGWNVEVPSSWGHLGVVADLGIQSYAAEPIWGDDGERPFGTLCAASQSVVDPDPTTIAVMRLFAGVLATAYERDRALRDSRRRAEVAEQRLRARIAFAAEVEHAMRTPLGVIHSWADTLLESTPDERTLKSGLETIRTASARVTTQLSALLVEARAAVANEPPGRLDVAEHASSMSVAVSQHPFTVEGELVLHTDVTAVSVLLEHLVENAVIHTPGGTPIRVLLGPGSIVVEDDGPGLPPRADLFEPFVSADPDRVGNGLGLHIACAITEQLGGEIAAGASPSGGARFEVTLPDELDVTHR